MRLSAVLAAVPIVVVSVVAGAGCSSTFDMHWTEKPAAPATSPRDLEKAAALVQSGDALWAERGADKAKLMQAIDKWGRAAEISPTTDVAVKLARAYVDVGADVDVDHERGLRWAIMGIKLSAPRTVAAIIAGQPFKDAVKQAPNEAAPSLHWFTCHLASWSASHGASTQAKYRDDLAAASQRARDVDPRYTGACDANVDVEK